MQVAATKPSLTFFKPEDVRRLGVDVWTDDDEWDVRPAVAFSVPNRIVPYCPLRLLTMLARCSPLFPNISGVAGKLSYRRPDIAHRAPALGRYRAHRALLRQHAREDRHGGVRQPSSKHSPLYIPFPSCPKPFPPPSPRHITSHHIPDNFLLP